MGTVASICAVVLAGGASSRMGGAKLLLPFAGSTLLERAVGVACASAADCAGVVTGAYHEAMLPALARLGGDFAVVRNERWECGQSSSVHTAVRLAQARKCDGVLLMVADQPFVATHHLDALIREYRASRPAALAASDGRRCGNPCLFDQSLFASLLELTGDAGARALLRRRPDLDVRRMELGEPRLFEDVDTPQDLKRIEEMVLRG